MTTALVAGAIVVNIGGVIALVVATAISYRRRQHKIVTYVRTTRQLWDLLEDGLRNGDGLPVEQRAKIYAAADEQWEAIRNELPSAHWLMDVVHEEGD